MQAPMCVRCGDVPLRLQGRKLLEVYQLEQIAQDAALDARVWVCPKCRRIELQWPEDVPLPEEELSEEENYARQLGGMTDKELHAIVKSELRSEGIRAAAQKLLEQRIGGTE